jgi:hypothetical protein
MAGGVQVSAQQVGTGDGKGQPNRLGSCPAGFSAAQLLPSSTAALAALGWQWNHQAPVRVVKVLHVEGDQLRRCRPVLTSTCAKTERGTARKQERLTHRIRYTVHEAGGHHQLSGLKTVSYENVNRGDEQVWYKTRLHE